MKHVKLSPEDEREILEALTDPNLDWMVDPHGTAKSIIRERLSCSKTEAKRILTMLYVERELIECVSESAYGPRSPGGESRWTWVQKKSV